MTAKAQTPAQRRVAEFLDSHLPPGATRLSGQLKDAGEVAGVPWRSVQRHAKAIGVDFEESANTSGRETIWTRPADSEPAAPEPATDDHGVPVRRGQLGRQAAALLGRYGKRGQNR